MKRSELAGITLLSIVLISVNAYTKQDSGQFSEDRSVSTPAEQTAKNSAGESQKTVVAEIETSAEWAAEATFKSHDY